MREVELLKEPVELYKILKFEGLVASGGEAKSVIADSQVLVNGQVETRKRKKIVSGDIVEFRGEKFTCIVNKGPTPGTGKTS
jgi:ribosome-associated protein